MFNSKFSKPIDKIKLFEDSIVYLENRDKELIICNINSSKIDFDKISNLKDFEQNEEILIVERIDNIKLFIASDKKQGFSDFNIELKTIFEIKVF